MVTAVQTCARCQSFLQPLHRPLAKTTLARFFNHVAQADTFTLLGERFSLFIDECMRWKLTDLLKDATFQTLLRVLLVGWFRFFGPFKYLVVDQESALAGGECAALCDKFSINRIVTGSDPAGARMAARHTATGLAEKHIDLMRHTMLKAYADMLEAGLPVELSDLAQECSMAHNILLTFNGVSPVAGVTGHFMTCMIMKMSH